MVQTIARKYKLLDGREVDLGKLDARQRAFLAGLDKMARQDVSYFEVYRTALGPGSPALGGRNRIDRKLAETPLYLAAQDMATRVGIAQGLILAPEHENQRSKAPDDASMISVTQAASLIGISRAAVYKAIDRDALDTLQIGNVTVVNRQSAEAYRIQRDRASRRVKGDQPANRTQRKRRGES